MVNKIYTLLKSSYKKENGIKFVDNLFFGQASSLEELKNILRGTLLSGDIESIRNSDGKDVLFFVTYSQSYEKKFYHGFSIQIMDVSSGKQYMLNISNDKKEYDTVISMIEDIKKDMILGDDKTAFAGV